VTVLVKARSVIGLLCRLSGLSPEGQIVSHTQFPYLAKTCSDGKGLCPYSLYKTGDTGTQKLEDTIKPTGFHAVGFQSRAACSTCMPQNTSQYLLANTRTVTKRSKATTVMCIVSWMGILCA